MIPFNLKVSSYAPCECTSELCINQHGTVQVSWVALVHPSIPTMPQCLKFTPGGARQLAASLSRAAAACEESSCQMPACFPEEALVQGGDETTDP